MLDQATIDLYLPTIGVEIHVQLNTKTKLFSAVDNDARNAEPNTKVSPICFGLPGVMPVLNQEAVEKAIRAGIALESEIAKFSKFDRKHYFYPDLPKGYQITQYDKPTVKSGSIDVPVGDDYVKVGITRAHLEEDAGKSIHPEGKDYSLVDLNRAGTPLLEIVSEPDIHSAEVAKAYAQEIYYRMKYAGVSNVDLYHGNMRFDVNISVAKRADSELGTRSEVKNLNSFKAVEKATNYEIKRQIELLEAGKAVIQETRGWLDDKQKTVSQRSKEDAHDYRYFPEPDLPPVIIIDEQIDKVRKTMPKLPDYYRSYFKDAGLDANQVEILIANRELLDLVYGAPNDHLVRISNWLTSVVLSEVNDKNFSTDQMSLSQDNLVKLSTLVEQGKLNSTAAKEILLELIAEDFDPAVRADQKGLIQESDETELQAIVDKVIKANEKAAQDVANGEMKAIGFLVGQVMKESKGKANPKMVTEILRSKLKGE